MDGAVVALTRVAAYDVREDDRRSRLAALLQVHGDRVQKSVFLLSIDEPEFCALQARAMALIDVEVDSLWFARQCADCWAVVVTLGQSDLGPRSLHWAVL